MEVDMPITLKNILMDFGSSCCSVNTGIYFIKIHTKE